jgi:hypothetical protein
LELLQFLIMNFNHPVCPKDHPKRDPNFSRGLPITKHSTMELAL